MNNLDNIKQLSDAEFLSFLYSERNRYKDKDSQNGWTLWAIYGSIFGLCVYIYNLLESCNAKIDIKLCYYILCTFLPLLLHFQLMHEKTRGFHNGDSKHIARLSDIAPIGILLYIAISYLALMAFGIYLKQRELVYGNLIAAVPSVLSLVIIIVQRKKFVTTHNSFVVSSVYWIDQIILFLLPTAYVIPFTHALRKLAFGFTTEFELCMALVVIILLSYLTLRIKYSTSIEEGIGEIIEKYLYKDYSKEETIEQLERVVLGKRPSDELEFFFNKLITYESSIPIIENRLNEIENSLNNKCIGIKKLKEISTEVDKDFKITKEILDIYNKMLDRSKELLSLKSVVKDKEFLTMLDLILNPDTFNNYSKAVTRLQERIISLLKKVTLKCQSSVCTNKSCHYRKAGE